MCPTCQLQDGLTFELVDSKSQRQLTFKYPAAAPGSSGKPFRGVDPAVYHSMLQHSGSTTAAAIPHLAGETLGFDADDLKLWNVWVETGMCVTLASMLG